MSKQQVLIKNQVEENEIEDETTKGLSKGQKKKLKEQKKKEQQRKKKLEQEALKGGNTEVGDEVKTEQLKGQGKVDKKKKGGKGNVIVKLAQQRMQALQKLEDDQERKRKEQQVQQKRKKKQQQERKKNQEQEKARIIKIIQDQKNDLKQKGLYLNKTQQQKMDRARTQLNQMNKIKEQTQLAKQGKFEETQIPEKQKTEEELKREEQKKEKIRQKDQKLLKDKKSDFQIHEGKFRSPVCCILGHVDTGKTTLLDKLRRTNVQEGEAGGITQQIGATFFPQAKLIEEVKKCKNILDIEVEVPGLLIIDTPGHESFSNLRSRGQSMCDIAILVIDIQHGLQKQTLQSLELLSKGKTPFLVALNKIDRSYGWKTHQDGCSYQSLKMQNTEALHDYKTKRDKVMLELNQKGYNAALYWENEDDDEYISLVPTSGFTGEGLPDLLSKIVSMCLTKETIRDRIEIKKDRFKCTVMEVKMLEGHGATVDCLLLDGFIKKDDQIVLLGFQGPIITKVKALLTPQPMKQMRIKDEYLHHDIIYAANGVKIAVTHSLETAVAGSPLIVANTQQEVQYAIAICKDELVGIKKKFKLEALGVGVAASTLGSLQALLEYLKGQKIPVSYISVGPVSKQDVIKSMKSILSESIQRRKQQFACMLVFDVKILADAQKYAEQNGIKIFVANIIYHLTDHFNKHVQSVKDKRKEKQGKDAIFPCILKQVQTFRKSDPIVMGVDVEAGVLKIGTPICVYKDVINENIQKNGEKQVRLGYVQSIEHNHKKLTQARKKTGSVAISLAGQPNIMSGRHFDPKDNLTSMLSRKSIDCLKEHYKTEMTTDDWKLVVELKKYFSIL